MNTDSRDREMDVTSSSNGDITRGRSASYATVLKFVGAFVCLGFGVLTWILMAEVLQGLFKEYPKPYFLAYWIHGFYAVLYVGWKLWREFPGGCRCNQAGDGALHWKTVLWSSAVVGVAAMVSAYFWYLSLTRTSVPANTAVYQSCVAFVFVLSVPILRERVTVVKVTAVLFAIGGVALISLFSEKDRSTAVENTPLGYVYLIISTVLYAVIEVLFKKFASPKDDPAAVCNSFRFVGIMGVHSLLWMWVPLIVLHFTAIEPFEFPSIYVLKLMFLNAVMDVIYNAAVYLCIALSSPLFASVGVITAIPLSVVVDYIINHKTSTYPVYIGMILIAIGFTGFCVSEFVASKKERQNKLSIQSKVTAHSPNHHQIVTSVAINEESQLLSQPDNTTTTTISSTSVTTLLRKLTEYIV